MKTFDLDKVQVGYLGSVSFIGMFFGAMFSGFFSDKIGGTKLLQWAMLFWGICGLLCAVSWSYGSLAFFRFILGFGLGAELPVATASTLLLWGISLQFFQYVMWSGVYAYTHFRCKFKKKDRRR